MGLQRVGHDLAITQIISTASPIEDAADDKDKKRRRWGVLLPSFFLMLEYPHGPLYWLWGKLGLTLVSFPGGSEVKASAYSGMWEAQV